MVRTKLKLNNSQKEYEKALSLIPGGVLGIRRPYNFVPGEYPIFFDKAEGGKVWDVDGNEYIDFLCAYGPIIVGHQVPEIDDKVIEQIKTKGFCFSLTQTYQNQLAEKMNELVPCAEMSLFVTTGSDATTTSIRLARAYTKKLKVMRCGYHGWHDWCVEVKGGVPEKLYEDVYEFHYNKLNELETLLQQHGDDTAAIIITPYGHPTAYPMQDPAPGFLEGVRKLADQYKTVLIFDEIRTGFRITMGGAQKYYGVTPDVAVFGKALANGYPIGAICGKEEIMKMGETEVFISSTFFPNSLSYVAALTNLEYMEKNSVLDVVWEKGRFFMAGIQKAIDKYPEVGARLSGIPPMHYITFDKEPTGLYKKRRNDFFTQVIRGGVFLQPYHHGYVCFKHTQEDLEKSIRVIEETMEYIAAKDYE